MKRNLATMVRRSLMGLALAGSLSAGFLVSSGYAESSLGSDIRSDRRDIRQDRRKLRRDIRKHGVHSRQAKRDRADLFRDRRDIRKDLRQLRGKQSFRNSFRDHR